MIAVVVIAAVASGVHLLPLLLVAVCPLSMVVMMAAMGGAMGNRPTVDSPAPGPGDPTTAEELAQLRAELDRLRAERAGPGQAGPGPEQREI